MRSALKPRIEILASAQQRLWLELGPAAVLGFVLYGGTAIALRPGHRASVDFDFFSEKPLDREAIQAAFPFIGQSTVLQDERNIEHFPEDFMRKEIRHPLSKKWSLTPFRISGNPRSPDV